MTEAELRKLASDAADIVTTDRNEQYGQPEDNFSVVASLWNGYLASVDGELTEPDIARMMELFKMARRMTATSYRPDSFVDAIGYVLCEARITEKEDR